MHYYVRINLNEVINLTHAFFSNYQDDIISCNHLSYPYPDSVDFPLHTHDICELIFLKKGDISGIINGKIYKLQKNDLIIFRPRVLHGIQPDSNKEYERFDILFDEKKIANNIFEKIPKDLDVVNLGDNAYMKDIFKKLDIYFYHFKEKDLSKLITNLIEELVFNLSLIKENKREHISFNSLVNKAIEFIDNNYKEQITIDDICTALYISKSHLHHLFISNLHISPKKYLNLQRLSLAQNMIREGLKPYDIYNKCGFNDYATFFRNYKQHFGHNPSTENETEIERRIES